MKQKRFLINTPLLIIALLVIIIEIINFNYLNGIDEINEAIEAQKLTTLGLTLFFLLVLTIRIEAFADRLEVKFAVFTIKKAKYNEITSIQAFFLMVPLVHFGVMRNGLQKSFSVIPFRNQYNLFALIKRKNPRVKVEEKVLKQIDKLESQGKIDHSLFTEDKPG